MAAAAPATPGSEITTMQKFEVKDVPLEKQILPTARPFSSVFGTDDNIVDVPRNVTIISRQQLSDIAIASVLDFTKLTSSAYSTTNFGAPANPAIRGLTADIFINGVRGRITSNGNGLPLDFNAVESVNIVKGPATAVQGTSMYVGGFVDLVTKRPYFDATKGSASVTVGSYSQREWTFDQGGPISQTAAYRFSYSGTDSKGYSWDYYNKNHSIYGALTLRPTKGYEVFINATAAFYRYTENWGINRVTQDLIDNGNYLTGVNSNAAPDFARYPFGFRDAAGNAITFANINTIGGTAAPVSDPQNSRWVTSGFPAGNRVVFGPTVKISRHQRLLKPGDHSTGREFNLQAIQTFTVSPELKVTNNSFASYTARNTLSSYYYSEIIDPSWFAENRTEFVFTRKSATVNVGLDIRYQRTKAYDDYFFEPANVWDLTKDMNFVNVYNSVNFPNPFTSLPVPGWPGRYATDGIQNGDTNDSKGITIGPFAQGTWRISEQLSFVAGGRLDHFHADVTEPLLAAKPSASISVWIPNYNASLTFKPTATSSIYVTYNKSKNTSGAVGNGGGITGWNAAGTALFKDNFLQPSELIEVGSKYALMDSKVFLNFAVFDQKRTFKSTSSTIIQQFRTKGFEAEMNYQPNKHLYGTVSYSYIGAKSSAGFQSDGGVGQFFASKGTEGRVSGLPRHLFNALVSYTLDSGWSFTTNGMVTGEMINNFAGTLTIPRQFQIDGSVAYRTKDWEYRVNLSNITDEKNWAPPNAVYGNASILPLPGTMVRFTAKYSF
ncbi:MAG: TonB-dependent receptor plug domain-containing protein [Opitutaceae bacterium]|nr:TonB-dependent receptor plug domain-containing protein [Opitutaceae bacterium]